MSLLLRISSICRSPVAASRGNTTTIFLAGPFQATKRDIQRFHNGRRLLANQEQPQHQSSGFNFTRKPPPTENLKTSRQRKQTSLLYVLALAVVTAGGSYAAVPLYKMFCQSTGYGGTVQDGSAGHGSTERVRVPPSRMLIQSQHFLSHR